MKRINLQICVPYQKCPFNCPMCIAADNNKFKDLYSKNNKKYFKQLHKALKKTNGDIIITGATEPTLNIPWVLEVANYIKKNFPNRQIELQTHNLNFKTINNIFKDVLNIIGYSITSKSDVFKTLKLQQEQIINTETCKARFTILATNEVYQTLVEHKRALAFRYLPQVTVKELQLSKNTEVNKYIEEHKHTAKDFSNLPFNTASLRIDLNCQDSLNRYRIFREDGKLYKRW